MPRKYRTFLVILLLEKIVQHVVVSLAFIFNIGNLRFNVAVDYNILLVVGVIIGLLYLAALISVLKAWSLNRVLVAIPALMDIVGEFVAQGRLDIVVTVSYVVAFLILGILFLENRFSKKLAQ